MYTRSVASLPSQGGKAGRQKGETYVQKILWHHKVIDSFSIDRKTRRRNRLGTVTMRVSRCVDGSHPQDDFRIDDAGRLQSSIFHHQLPPNPSQGHALGYKSVHTFVEMGKE